MLTFKSRQFDIASEPPNDLNPIFGHDLGELLRQELASKGHVTDENVDSEDWGWYFHVKFNTHRYMIGTSAYVEADPITEKPILTTEPIEFLIQFEKQRSLKEKLFRQNKMDLSDPIIEDIEMILNTKVEDIKNLTRGI